MRGWLPGSMHFECKQYKEVLADAEEAIKVNANFPGAQTLKGNCMYALGTKEVAVPAFQAALRNDPNVFDANLFLCVLYSQRGDDASARQLLELALTLRPDGLLHEWSWPRFTLSGE